MNSSRTWFGKTAHLALAMTSVVALNALADDAGGSAAPPRPAAKAWWSYQPVQPVAIPAVKEGKWVRTPIDAFVLAKLEEKNLKPSPEADRATLIRRATLDVWGLIPTPEEVKAFVKDRSPEAYEKLVDRLLASPHYAERQARRWLDLARYADSSGYTNDETRPNMWRYRDYVIDAFDTDKPYDRFVKEQLAGDELDPQDQQSLIATGFLRSYPDDSNSRDLVLKKYENTTDMVDTVSEVFLAQTAGCARCHDHKFDRISQKEYFSLQAFFANVSASDDIPAAKGEQELQYAQAQAQWEEATKDVRAAKKAILDSVREKAVHHYKTRYLPDTREALFKSPEQWTAFDRWINHRYELYASEGNLASYLEDSQVKEENEAYTQYKKLDAELKKFDKLKPGKGSLKISAMTELGHSDAPATYLLFTGSHDKPVEEVQPAFPAAIANGEQPAIVPTATSSGRRLALANWIASPGNPLTARVFVNRVWSQYFSHGIVGTVSDFGKAGQRPSNPALLDYLAGDFVKQGWSSKRLHRQILLSSVYRQSSAHRDDAYAVDPENILLWSFPRQRLDAEQIRDSLLVASGLLVDKVGGPSVFAPVPANMDTGGTRALWKVSDDKEDHYRRSLYIFTRRSVPYPLLEVFDMASPQAVHSRRDVTTTAPQALALLNSDLVYEWSKALAGRVIREAGGNEAAQIDRLYQILFSRAPDKVEKSTLLAYLDRHEQVLAQQASEGTLMVNLPVGLKNPATLNPIRAAAFVDVVHALANANEFTYRL